MKILKKIISFTVLILLLFAVGTVVFEQIKKFLIPAKAGFTPLTLQIKPQDFLLKIQAIGELQSAETTKILVPNVPAQNLRIATLVPDGRSVKKGDLLVEFDPTELNLQFLEQKSNLEIANHKISKSELAAEVDKSDIIKDKKVSQLELEKISQFQPKDESIYTRRQILEGELNKDYTQQKIVFADARLELKGKVYSLDEAILVLERQKASSKIDQAEKALSSLKLTSPSDGVVDQNSQSGNFWRMSLMPGTNVYVGMPLFDLINPNKMEAKCYVLEKDAGSLKIDQTVTVTLDPFPDKEFTGKVKNIDKLARPIDRGSPVKYFQTTISLDNVAPEIMKSGIKLKAQILAQELKTVLVVPRSALLEKDGKYFAYVKTQKTTNQTNPINQDNQDSPQFEAKAVTLGQGDLIQVVVTEGLEIGQVIALNPPNAKQNFSQQKKTENPGNPENKK
ncbi:MAG: hypothetical protein FD167_3349 [bacterium]|nr:MAG: hypothetical protein FD167_3349 [bacterium]